MALNFEELLKQIHDGNGTESAVLSDDEEAIQLDGITRAFIIPENYNTQIGTTNDYNSNEITLTCPKFIDKHDITKCSYQVLKWFNVASQERGASPLIITKETDDYVHFTCIIPPEAMTRAGQLQIAVCFMDEAEDEIVYKWNSTICQALFIAQGLDQVAIKGTPLSRIVTVDMYNRTLILPAEFNTTIAYVGDVGTSKITFRVDRFHNNVDFKNAQLDIRWLDAEGKQQKSRVGVGKINPSLDGNELDDWIEYDWIVPNGLTQTEGPIELVLSLRLGDGEGMIIWNSAPFREFLIGAGFIYDDIVPTASDYVLTIVPEDKLMDLLKTELEYVEEENYEQ